ncbi:DUF5049 domain-containing protein [Cohnella fermenti]|uniref:DUF5049 domain-containing protein n=1 Tax=Cohnella fermenti TaxID=2565925 RepID=A0A4V3WE07_9BACL|nr:DUF5049 domain-containing protein [Cohnella fermenti]THF74378.1 DUF5049 domain-containing protein [Cohnella fermenti]
MKVPKRVYEGLEAVRSSGRTNMLIVSDVLRCARSMGYPETAQWIEDNRNPYWEGIFQGFSPSD